MLTRLFYFIRNFWFLLGVIIIYTIGTGSALLVPHHFLYNLEPYPDGLLYTVSAQNLVAGHGLQLWWPQGTFALETPPLYSLVLAIGYFFNQSITTFYAVNMILGILSITALFTAIRIVAQKNWPAMLGVILYLCHGQVWWLPSLPMTENLSLLLVSLTLLGFSLHRRAIYHVSLSSIGLLGLLFTRYAAAPQFAIGGLVLWWSSWIYKRTILLFLAGSCILVSGLLLLINMRTGSVPFLSNLVTLISEVIFSPRYYSFSFSLKNIAYYSVALLGGPNRFLWSPVPFTSPLLLLLFISGIVTLIRNPSTRFWGASVLVLFLAQFPLLLIFYDTDSRYLASSLIFLSAGAPFFFGTSQLSHFNKKIIFGMVVLTLLIPQRQFIKQLLAANLAGRSMAWQYEATVHLTQYLANQPTSYLVTAIPPYLFSAYHANYPHILPLSAQQEFIKKNKSAWTTPALEYTNLANTYRTLLLQGNKLYITNAYLTHNALVISDFERYKSEFNLTLVSSGCQEACDLYTLELPAHEKIPQ